MKKILLVSIIATLILAAMDTVEAQQPTKMPRIGYLATRNSPTSTTPDPAADAFQQGLRDLGYVEGKNILVEYRYAGGSSEDRIQDPRRRNFATEGRCRCLTCYVGDSYRQAGD